MNSGYESMQAQTQLAAQQSTANIQRPDRLSASQLYEHLLDPPAIYRAIPFWSWNDRMDPEEIRRQVREMKQAGLGGYIMHARAGLETPYMGDEWMECIAAGIEEGERLGMQVWCYDENGWPSGFADGVVPQLGLEYQQKLLRMEWLDANDSASAFKSNERTIALYYKEKDRYVRVQSGQEHRAELRIYYEVNPYYIDTLDAHVVRAFIESTYEKYAERFAGHFGQAVAGIFTDEPQYGRNQIPWSFTLEQQYAAAYRAQSGRGSQNVQHELDHRDGTIYTEGNAVAQTQNNEQVADMVPNLLDDLPSIFLELEGYEEVRYRFWQLATRLFAESFMKQIGDWCGEHQIRLTGHVVCEDHLTAQTSSVGDAMASYEYMQTPGIDWLGRFIDNPLTPKQASSVAHQLGQKFVLSETFGCSGWNVSFADLKWIAEWQYVHGINLMCQHLEGYSMRGIRKRDYPPSLYYQQPWWSDYSRFNDYFSRLSLLLSESTPQHDILLLHPIRSAWLVYNNRTYEEGERLNRDFVAVSEWLCGLHYGHDYGSESIIDGHGHVQQGEFVIGQSSYRTVILPPMLTISSYTLDLLLQLLEQGGQVLALGTLPSSVEGKHDDRLAILESRIPCLPLERSALADYLEVHVPARLELTQLIQYPAAAGEEQESYTTAAIGADGGHSAELSSQPDTIQQQEAAGNESTETPAHTGQTVLLSRIGTLDDETLIYLVNTDRVHGYHAEFVIPHAPLLTMPSSGSLIASQAAASIQGSQSAHTAQANDAHSSSHQEEATLALRIERIDLQTGKHINLTSMAKNHVIHQHDQTTITLEFAPAESYMLRIIVEETHEQEAIDENIANPHHDSATQAAMNAATDISTALNSAGKVSIPLQEQWQLQQTDLNSLTLDLCSLRVDGGAWQEAKPVIFIQEELVQLGRAVNIELAFVFEAEDGAYLDRELYLIMEQPQRYEITVNGQRLPSQELGWWRDIAFRKLDLCGQVQPGRNEIMISGTFRNSEETYEAAARAQQFESEGNKMFYDTELESIYLLGDFAVQAKAGYEEGERGAIYTAGQFVLQEPVRSVQTGDLTTQGLNFYAGNVTLTQQLEVPQLEQGQTATFVWNRPDAVLSRLWLNGHEVHTWMWAPYEADITDWLQPGNNEIALELMSSCRNLLGPHHHVRGELTMVGPDSFRDTPSWTDGNFNGEHIYTDRYCLVRFGLKGTPEIVID
ncbi:glycosyl hydrolase [Paenibacillus kandeliae]|uniref:glycosyl hydrolase n=1 Tax=Paenibacillus kandeliae TaxID=3231269 RepID=UPI00345867BC